MMFLRNQIFFIAFAAILFLAGCSSSQPKTARINQTSALVQTDYYFGSPISGAATRPTTRPATSFGLESVHITFFSLENARSTSFDPVGSRAIFLTSTGGNSTVLPAAELERDATITDLKFPVDFPALLRKANAGQIKTIAMSNGALPAGITASFSVSDPKSFIDPVSRTPFHRSIKVSVTAGMAPQLALSLNDFSAWHDGEFGPRTETSVFNLPAVETSNTGLVVPFQFSDAPVKAVAILIQISPGADDAGEAIAVKQASSHLTFTQPILSTGGPNSSSAIQTAVASLAPIAGRRSALVFLANQTGASVCEDVAMEADDATLAALVKSIRDKVQTDSNPGWLLDRCALELLAKLTSDSENGGGKMPAELQEILTNHTGEVGRHSSSMAELLRGLSSSDDLKTRLQVQNTIFLEDSSPAIRVRAFDWLSARHEAPTGYDPLSAGRQRREALEKAAGQS